MSGFLLTQTERDRFSQWLQQDIESAKLLIQQMEKLPQGSVVTAHMKQEVVAEIIVLKKLLSIEEVTIESQPKGDKHGCNSVRERSGSPHNLQEPHGED